MTPMRQADRRTGTACEAEARWAPRGRRSRHGRRRLVGHVDPGTGEVVPNRPTRASAPSPASRRESCGACAPPGAVADGSGVAAAPGRAPPGTWDQVPSLAHHVTCGAPPRRRASPGATATHATPHGAPIAPPRPSGLLAPVGEEGRDALCDSLAGRHGEGTGSPATPRRHRRARRRWPRSGGAATRTACRSRRRASRCWWGMAAACRRRRGRPGTPSTRTPGSPGAGGTTTRRPGRAAQGSRTGGTTGRGGRAPRAGGPPPPRVRGHREAARHLRQAGLRVADHVITLREFR